MKRLFQKFKDVPQNVRWVLILVAIILPFGILIAFAFYGFYRWLSRKN